MLLCFIQITKGPEPTLAGVVTNYNSKQEKNNNKQQPRVSKKVKICYIV